MSLACQCHCCRSRRAFETSAAAARAELEAAEKRCCDAAVALAKAESAREVARQNVSDTRNQLRYKQLYAAMDAAGDALRDVRAAGAELARLRGGL